MFIALHRHIEADQAILGDVLAEAIAELARLTRQSTQKSEAIKGSGQPTADVSGQKGR